MSEARHIVGIDLGTTHTVVASVRLDAPPGSPEAAPKIFEIEQLVAPGEVAARPLLLSLRYQLAEGELGESDAALPFETGAREGRYVVGELARSLGAKTPGRLVASAKSWLSHPNVDRTADILPWGAPSEVTKLSPVAASASFLSHVRAAWDHAHPHDPLASQDVVLTIPASFDEGARALTLEAAQRAGLPRVRLLEEPQAAFYDWLGHETDLPRAVGDVRLALVIDVGGGTTDLTFIRIELRESGPRLTRIAVGDHLMLGGDNMDLALARRVEQRIGTELGASRFTQLLVECRRAKEQLLREGGPESVRVTVLGSGSRLVGSSLGADVTRDDVRAHILDGFFPEVDPSARPHRRASALVEFGLPFAADAAITRHVAGFIARHQDVARDAFGPEGLVDGLAFPDAVLLNGGVFRGGSLAERMVGTLSSFRRAPVTVLPNHEPELAVARGAVFFGLARRGVGMKIGGGSARSHFLLLDPPKDAAATDAERAVCLLPRGAEEGEEHLLAERAFSLRLGAPVRFRLASSVGQAAYVRAGDIVELVRDPKVEAEDRARDDEPARIHRLDRDLFRELPPIAAVLDDAEGARGPSGAAREERVVLAASLTEIGTIEVGCLAERNPSRRWKLEFQLRGAATDGAVAPTRVTQLHARFADAKSRVEMVYGKSDGNVEGKTQKTLRADLEKILGARHGWDTPLLRELFASLFAGVKRRRRSADHERVWFNLVGFSLRPGFGYPLDDWRVSQLFEIFDQGVQFAPEAQNWSEWWTLWRRVAGGLDGPRQERVLATLDWYLHPPTSRPRSRPSGPKAQGYDDMVRLAGSLERVSVEAKLRVGGWLLERLAKHGEPAPTWWAVGRIGARVPLYGSAHHVIPRATAETWILEALRVDWKTVEPAPFAATLLARASGDRTRDVAEPLRREVARRLEQHGAPPSWPQLVREPTELEHDAAQRIFGESLPPGLSLID